MIGIQITDDKLKRANSILRKIPAQAPKITARALNRAVDTMRTAAVKETSKRYYAKSSKVRQSISLKKASANKLKGEMVSRDKRHSLAEYQLTPKSPKKGRSAEYKGAVMKEGGLKKLRGVFLVKRAGGQYVPFVRVGSAAGASYYSYKHQGIRSLISPAFPQIIKNRDTVNDMYRHVEETFIKRLDHEILQLFGALP